MEQIIIQVKDREKAKLLSELLAALDFVESIETVKTEDSEIDSVKETELLDFFSLAGLWVDREISLETIRQKAWPRQ